MNIKTFHIRTGDQLHLDEQTINQFMDTVKIKKTATEFVTAKQDYWSVLVFYEKELQKHDSIMHTTSDKISFPADTVLNKEESFVFNTLLQWRRDMAIKYNLASYLICHNSELTTIAKIKPKNLEELGKIKGFGAQKLLKYGNDILALLNSVYQNLPVKTK